MFIRCKKSLNRLAADLPVAWVLTILLVISLACSSPSMSSYTPQPADSTSPSDTITSNDTQVPTLPPDTALQDTSLPSDTTVSEDTGSSDTSQPPPTCQCDDGNPCTKDTCPQLGVCEHLPIKTQECAPKLEISWPLRAATLSGVKSIKVQGTVTVPSGQLVSLKVNGVDITPNEAGAFSADVNVAHGVNVIHVDAVDASGGKDTVVQSFVAADGYYPTGSKTAGESTEVVVPDGLKILLGKEVWDDNNTNDVNDMATFAQLMLQGMDVDSLIPHPFLQEGDGPGILWCQWTVDVYNVEFEVESVDIVPQVGGLGLTAVLKNFSADYWTEESWCPDAKGKATIETVTVTAQLDMSLSAAGVPEVSVKSVKVTLSGLNAGISGGVAVLFGWLVDWFKEDLGSYVESAAETMLKGQVAPAIEALITTYASYTTTFLIPPLPGSQGGVEVTVSAQVSDADMWSYGADLKANVSASAPAGFAWSKSPGAIKRGGCLKGQVDGQISLPKGSPISFALHDDLVNEALFAGWWGGILSVNLDQNQLATFLTLPPDLPVSTMNVTLDPKLPPIMTGCGTDGKAHLQVGDLRVLVVFDINGIPGAFEVYVSAGFKVSLNADTGPAGSVNIGLNVEELAFFDFELVGASGIVDGTEPFVEAFVTDVVVDVVFETISTVFMQGFPIPMIDVGAFLPGVPAGTTIGFSPTSTTRMAGHTVISGTLVE